MGPEGRENLGDSKEKQDEHQEDLNQTCNKLLKKIGKTFQNDTRLAIDGCLGVVHYYKHKIPFVVIG